MIEKRSGNDPRDDFEERRNANRRHHDRVKRWRWKALTVWIILFTGLVFFSLRQISSDRTENRAKFADAIYQNCFRTNSLLTQLIKPGIENTSKLEYYRTHTDEKILVLAQIHAALDLANPHNCQHLPINQYRKGK